MPRSSRHKSSKHSSRDAREYSDSEKETSLKERKGKEDSVSGRVLKESASSEKRKENKDSFGTGNGDYSDEYSSSKRRKQRVEENVSDRWDGGEDEGGDGLKKSKEKLGESRSKRRDGSVGVHIESEEMVKKSSGKSEGKHRESGNRREGKEGGSERDRERERERERERKVREGKSDKFDSEDPRPSKQVSVKTELLPSPGSENQGDKRIRRKRDGSGDGDKYQDDVTDTNDRRFSSREDTAKDGRGKDEKNKDEKYRDKYREDVDKESRHGDDKQREERAARDHTNRSDDKHLRDEKGTAEIRQKKSKLQDGGYDCDHENYHRDRDRNQDCDLERIHDHGRDHDRSRDRDRERDHDRDCDLDWDRTHDRDRDRTHDRDRDQNYDCDHDRERDRERNVDYDGAHIDDRSARYKESRGRKRSPDDCDDYHDAKSRAIKAKYSEMDKKSFSSVRVESDVDRGRSQSRQAYLDNNVGSNWPRTSPNTNSHVAAEEYRNFKSEELKYRDAVTEQRPKSISSREATGYLGASERAPKKLVKMDDSHVAEISQERSSSSKASPRARVERSPSSSSLERRYTSRTGVRRSLDIEESGRKSSTSEDRPSRDLPSEKTAVDESLADSSFYNRTSQSNSSLIPPPHAFRGGVSSPSFLGSLEEDGRMNSSARYKRSSDPNLGRGQGPAWRGAPNWSSPVPNGYLPFQHGPPHGGFQAMMPQFPSPPLFGMRPSMDINHSGIPYTIPDADRFSGQFRPLGWQSMMDGSGPSHLHGWDGNNGVFRDEMHMYGGPDWDQNRHPMNGRGWEIGADMWKGQNGDVNMDLPSGSAKEDFPVQSPLDDALTGQTCQRSQNENNHPVIQAKTTEIKSVVASSPKESFKSSPKTTHDIKVDSPNTSSDDTNAFFSRAYLSKLDISVELVDPELYNEFTILLNMEEIPTAVEDIAVLVNLKDGARAVSKSCSALLSPLFPATSDSVFKKAMDIYKQQKIGLNGLPIIDVGTADVISESKIEEQVPVNSVEMPKEPVLHCDVEMLDVPVELDQKNGEIIPDVLEKSEEMMSAPSQDGPVSAQILDLTSELPEQTLISHDRPEKPQIPTEHNIEGILPELVNSEDAQGDFISTPDKPEAVASLSIDGQINETGKITDHKVEGQGFGDEMCGPLLLTDGSPKACGTLMPESNESESVNLSRIHHSPESTH